MSSTDSIRSKSDFGSSKDSSDGPFPEGSTDHLYQVNARVGKDIIHAAGAAADAEHKMTVWTGLKTYPKAIGWSVAISTCIIMIGYNTLLLGSFFALPSGNKQYGQPDGKGSYTFSTAWQIGLTDDNAIGSIIGIVIGGWSAELWGYKRTLGLFMILTTAFIFLTFFAPDVIMLEVGIIFRGLPCGMFQSLSITHAAEVCPTKPRCYLMNYVNLCWIIGQIIGSGVRGVFGLDDKWGYKIPFAVQ